MINECIQAALSRANYEIIREEEPYYGEISDLKGVGQQEGVSKTAAIDCLKS